MCFAPLRLPHFDMFLHASILVAALAAAAHFGIQYHGHQLLATAPEDPLELACGSFSLLWQLVGPHAALVDEILTSVMVPGLSVDQVKIGR